MKFDFFSFLCALIGLCSKKAAILLREDDMQCRQYRLSQGVSEVLT
jgi:hypothetical protein